jgi:hypothetical protein
MLSGGSWVFNKANNDVYACFRIKSTVPVDEMVTRVSFKFLQLRGSKLYKKQNQAMETETSMMLLFVSNNTDPQSIASDSTQMLETAYDSIKMDGMMPEEFGYKEIPKLTLKLNVPQLPLQMKQAHKNYDHFKEQGKKTFHCKVAKEHVPFFRFLGGFAHRLWLEVTYFGKFTKFTETLPNNAPLSNCTKLQRCMQGHLNFHLSSTSLVLNGINNLDTTEILRNMANSSTIAKVTLQEILYRLCLENESPLFLQLTQRPLGEVDAVIPNTPEAEFKAEKINQQVAAWCLNYWTESNPGGAAFYRKLANRRFSQVLLHEVRKCLWDSANQTVTSPRGPSEAADVAEFKNQDWVKDILNRDSSGKKRSAKAYANPNVLFPFEDDFSVGTIHGANTPQPPLVPPVNEAAPISLRPTETSNNQTTTIEILDNNAEEDVSVLTTKMQEELVALLVKARLQIHAPTGSQVASGSGNPPGGGPVATPSHPNEGRQQTAPTNGADNNAKGAHVDRSASNGPGGK